MRGGEAEREHRPQERDRMLVTCNSETGILRKEELSVELHSVKSVHSKRNPEESEL